MTSGSNHAGSNHTGSTQEVGGMRMGRENGSIRRDKYPMRMVYNHETGEFVGDGNEGMFRFEKKT